jgi:hypothetical protein
VNTVTLRTKLRDEVTARLVPELKRRRFIGPDKISGNAIFHNYSRPREGGVDRLSIQFEKRQKPRFALNVWVEPSDAIVGMVQREETLIQGRIVPGRGVMTGSWFRADRPWWQRMVGIRSSTEEHAVQQALSRLDAIEDWFRNPRATDVVRVVSSRYRNLKKTNAQPPH